MKQPETESRALGRSTCSYNTLPSIQNARLSFQSSELGSPTPSPARECCSSLSLGPRGEIHSLWGYGVGGPNSDEGTDTMVFCVYYNPSTVYTHHKASVSIIYLFSFYKEKKTSVFLATIQIICSVNSSDNFADMSSLIVSHFLS
jgi:hypothetical protein